MSHHPERTARNVRPVNQPPGNYYVCICSQYERIAKKEVPFAPMEYKNSLDGARMVKKLVADCITMMEKNASRNLWPW